MCPVSTFSMLLGRVEMRSGWLRSAAAVVILLVASGCGPPSGSERPDAVSENSTATGGSSGHGVRVREYRSLREVASFSTDLVIGEVTGRPKVVSGSTDTNDSVKSTLVTMEITEVLGGSTFRAGDKVVLRQFGTGSDGTFNQTFDMILKENETYATYLEPFYFDTGKPTGEYVIVGDVSALFSPQNSTATLTSGKNALPSSVSRQDLIQSVVTLGSKATPLGVAK